MEDFSVVSTSAEVWAVIRARHPELVVVESYSAPDGDYLGNPSIAMMKTGYGFPGAACPIIRAETTWTIDRCKPSQRQDETHKYWLCFPREED